MLSKIISLFTVTVILLFANPSFARSTETFFFSSSEVEALRLTLNNSGSVSGTVKEAGTGEELIGANVVIKGTLKGTSVDIEGKFSIRNVEAGEQVLVISYLGFLTKEIPIEIRDGENFEIEVLLEPQGVVGDEVTITAQARGQIAAINQQLSSNTISNIVAKDRIQELPDVNAAESVGRLPGISLQRSGGEANKVVIRGLSPRFNNVTVNGVRLPSTDTNNRSVDLSLVSSNALDGIEVTKANTPDKDADALGGTIDLKLRNASEGFAANLQIQGGYTALQETYDNYNINGSISNRFLKNKLGVILTANSDRYDRSADNFNGSYELIDPGTGIRFPRIQNITLNENAIERSRLGGSVIADYRIPKGKIIGSGIYNQLENQGFSRTNQLNVQNDNHNYDMSQNENTTSITALSLAIEQDHGWFEYDVGISSTSSDSESPDNLWWRFSELSPATLTGTFDPNTLLASEVQSIFENNIDETGLIGLNKTFRKTTDEEIAFQGNLKIPFSIGEKINAYVKTGFKVRRKDRVNDQNQIYMSNDIYYGGDGPDARRDIAEALFPNQMIDETRFLPLSLFQDDYTRSNFVNGDFNLGYTFRPDLMRQVTNILFSNDYMRYSTFNSIGNDYVGREEYDAYYAMAEFEIGKYVTFMPGFRFEEESTRYTAKYVDTNLDPSAGTDISFVYDDTTSQRDADFFLPMVHLKINPSEVTSLRFAYTKTINRPDFSQYAPITFYNAQGNWANAPNPNLKTAVSTNLDASFSYYQNYAGLVTVSGFYKEIEDLVWSTSFTLIENQQVLPELVIEQAAGRAPRVSTSINNPFLATIKGFELDWQTQFWYLPSIFKGVVLNINYTRIDSETEYPTFFLVNEPISPRPVRPPFTTPVLIDSSFASTLPDQPSDIFNLSLGYDLKGFSGRVSFLYQAKTTTGSYGSQATQVDDIFVDDYFRIDASIQQKLPGNIQVYLNLNNLNNREDRRSLPEAERYPIQTQYYGFTMDLGVRYKF
ncbi:MAG: TonB-dependent receptor [Balneolaceae bacterium]